jgi:pantoate--beta-alanine ligase
VVKRMAADLLLPLEIVGVPTVREADGLAMSSRNRFLSAEERARAPALIGMLRATALRLTGGEPASQPLADAWAALQDRGFGVDYFALVEGATLMPVAQAVSGARLIAVAKLGPVRLLDNIGIG